MKRLLHDLGLILALAALWAVSGYVIGLAIEIFIETLGPHPYRFRIIVAAINVILGMLLFKGITRGPTAERIFFKGPEPDQEGDFRVGCLWLMPATLLIYGLLTGVAVVLIRFLTK